MPAQPLLCAAALLNQIVALVDEQLDLQVGALARPWPAQVRLAQGSARDCERVDRV
jgi:hypothetical protein